MIKFIHEVIWPAIHEKKFQIFIAVLMMIITVLASILSLEVSRAAMQALQQYLGGEVQIDGLIKIFHEHYSTDAEELFWFFVVFSIVLSAATFVSQYFQFFVFEKISIRVTLRLREVLFDRMLRLTYQRHHELTAGRFIKRISEDTKNIRGLVLEAGLMRIADVVMVVGLLVYLFMLNVTLTLATVTSLGIYLVGAYWSAQIARTHLRAADASYEDVMNGVEQGFSHFMDIRVNRRRLTEQSKFKRLAEANANKMTTAVKYLVFDGSITGLLGAIGPLLILAVGGYLLFNDAVGFATVIAFIAAVRILFGPVNNLSAVPLLLTRSGISVNNIRDALNELVEEDEQERDQQIVERDEQDSGKLLAFREFSYQYPGSKQRISIDSLDILPGEKVALVGPSGCGKTTIFRLLFGLLRGYKGHVKFHGNELSSYSSEDLRKKLAFMLQNPGIMSASVFDNIEYGLGDDETLTQEEINELLELVNINVEVDSWSDGAQTLIGHQGQAISGGQERRIALARALARRPELVMLDEPLVGVSPSDRGLILHAILHATTNVGVLLSTHQTDLLSKMDKIICLDIRKDAEGGLETYVRNAGTHEELLRDDVIYREKIIVEK
ncbi:ABC transporter ATP-binding protein [Marinobacter lipolyticus]|uniref:ABC transporter ATP-binding protein n=1 Tax=Marinobacter lipolyticus TaxID=209639 RepID=UPI003A936F96